MRDNTVSFGVYSYESGEVKSTSGSEANLLLISCTYREMKIVALILLAQLVVGNEEYAKNKCRACKDLSKDLRNKLITLSTKTNKIIKNHRLDPNGNYIDADHLDYSTS
jgi:hypothetical protein